MPRYWNTGICLMALLINGLTSQSDNASPSTGVHQNLTCLIGNVTSNSTNCNNHVCPVGEPNNVSYACREGFRKDIHDCIDIPECVENIHDCGARTTCVNTIGGYYCKCEDGFQKGNLTEFCPSKNKKENKCTDIDECSKYPGICGSNLTCRNTPGSYKCICNEGFKNISNTCVVKCKYNTSKKKCDQDEFHCNLEKLRDNFTPFCENITSQEELSLEKFLGDLDILIDGFTYFNKTDRLRKAGQLLKTVETTVQNIALKEQKAMSHVNKKGTISIQVTKGTPDNGTLSLQGTNSSIKLDSKTAAGNTGVALLGSLEYTNITHTLEGADLVEGTPQNISSILVSPVVSVFLGISNTSSLQQPVSMRMSFTEEVNSTKMICVSWSVLDNSWTTKGCDTGKPDKNGVTCNCSHLTSFAVLMLLQNIEPYESWALTLLTQIGLSISIFCLVLAIITFYFCRALRGTRNTIHMHLCISLFLGNCIFLLGIEATQNKDLCGIIAGLLHAFYLCSFCWMALEGLELYLMLVTVFNTHLKKRYLLAVGYGVPIVIITISAAVYHKGYGTDKYCWLTREEGFIWAFMGPVCAIILVNCGIFVLTVWKLAEKMSSVSPEQGRLKRIRTLTVTSLAQLCILGSCWVFGFFMFSSATPFFMYAFTILNTLQGLQIFCLHCLMHKKVRAEYKMWLCALAHFKAPVYSEFSNTSNTHSHSKGKTGKESGL